MPSKAECTALADVDGWVITMNAANAITTMVTTTLAFTIIFSSQPGHTSVILEYMSSPSTPSDAGGAPDAPPPPDVVPCAGGLVFDDDGRLLLIRRGTPPARGSWSVPGGRLEPGETAEQACVREVAEETGLDVVVVRAAGRVLRDGPGGVVYAIDDFVCALLGGTLHAATDADDAQWVDAAEYAALEERGELAPLLSDALAGWGTLPRR